MLKIAGWNVDPLITITTAVRGAMHKQALEALQKLKIPPQGVKKLMEYIHQTTIRYLTYLVPNIRAWQQSSPNQPTHEPKHSHLIHQKLINNTPTGNYYLKKPTSWKIGSTPPLSLGKTRLG